MADVIKWLFDILNGIREFFTKPPADHIKDLAELLSNSVSEFLQLVASDGYRRLQGAFVGLSQDLIPGIVIIVVIIAAFTALGNSSKWWKRLTKAVGGYILLFALFGPVVLMATQVSSAVKDGLFTLANLTPSALAGAFSNIIGDIALLGGAEHFFAMLLLAISNPLMKLELELFKYLALALLLLYPVVLLLQPFGKWARRWLHASHASFCTIVFAPPVMSFVILGPHFLSLMGFGGKGTAQAVAIVICIFLATLVPFIVWGLANAGSVQVIGKIEASINGEVNTKHSGEVTAKIKEEPGPMKSFVTTVGFGTLGLMSGSDGAPGSFKDGMQRVAADAAAAALVAAGHPELAGLVQGLDASRRKRADEVKKNQPPAYQPPIPQPPPPPKNP